MVEDCTEPGISYDFEIEILYKTLLKLNVHIMFDILSQYIYSLICKIKLRLKKKLHAILSKIQST